jgi:glycosyltransferase involved in cell wall biosynthesis
MRIAQVATLCTPVRRDHCASVEGLVWLLSKELIRLGHEVTVFATADSEPPGPLVATLPAPYGRAGSPSDWQLCEWFNLCRAVELSAEFDVLHCHAYLWGLPLQRFARAPLVHTLHMQADEDQAATWRLAPASWITAISHYQWSAFPELKPAAVIHHGIDPERFTFQPEPEDYVCYLGRFIPEKGPLAAIAAARALGIRLVLAGQANPYFERHVKPHVDGRTVEYAGYLHGADKVRLLGGARALLYPLQAPEPFGLVVPEAMMCGTPVVALRLGAVTELVDEGITGYLAATADDFAALIPRSFALDRRRIRQVAEARFTSGRMAEEYARLYAQVLSRRGLRHECPRDRTASR